MLGAHRPLHYNAAFMCHSEVPFEQAVSLGVVSYAAHETQCSLRWPFGCKDVTAVTGCSSSTPLFFGHRVIAKSRGRDGRSAVALRPPLGGGRLRGVDEERVAKVDGAPSPVARPPPPVRGGVVVGRQLPKGQARTAA
jgi:hypothetical protein